jgi:4-diphosphocytidyl-2-C-methyl-D-erythritol kinase
VTVTEHAYAKVNLVLRVGPRLPGGLHTVCSVFASLALADRVTVREAGEDAVLCPGVEGTNLASEAVVAFRDRVRDLPPLAVTIEKRIPVAAGLGGGSADAAAVLRAANRLTGEPLSAEALRGIAAGLGSDVPSQVVPRHALVSGVGERVEAIELPVMALALLPAESGLATGSVFAELDRLRAQDGWEPAPGRLDPASLRSLTGGSLRELAAALENDLEAPAMSLRPELAGAAAGLIGGGALGAQVTGSGPTVFGIFSDSETAAAAAAGVPGAIVTETRPC